MHSDAELCAGKVLWSISEPPSCPSWRWCSVARCPHSVPGPPSIRLYLSPLWAVSVGTRQWVTSNQCTPAPITSPLSTLPCPVSSSQLTGLFSSLLYLPPITCPAPAICLIKWETEKCLQSISADQVSAGCISSPIPYIVILQLAQSIYIQVKLITETRRQQVINCLSEWGSRKLRNVV